MSDLSLSIDGSVGESTGIIRKQTGILIQNTGFPFMFFPSSLSGIWSTMISAYCLTLTRHAEINSAIWDANGRWSQRPELALLVHWLGEVRYEKNDRFRQKRSNTCGLLEINLVPSTHFDSRCTRNQWLATQPDVPKPTAQAFGWTEVAQTSCLRTWESTAAGAERWATVEHDMDVEWWKWDFNGCYWDVHGYQSDSNIF